MVLDRKGGMAKQIIPKRGEIYLVGFDPTIGAEIKKTRPALILQNNIGNQYSPVTIVAAITSVIDGNLYPTEVFFEASENRLDKDSLILLNQIRTIDKKRLIKRIGKIGEEIQRKVDQALQISLGLVEI